MSRDRTVSPAHDPSGQTNPTLLGARLRVWSDEGTGFDGSYELPAAYWRTIGAPGNARGYRYKDRRGTVGPVRAVVMKDAVLFKIVARGALDISLAMDPNPVGVSLTIGDMTYCESFGGRVKFTSARSYVARNAPVASCP